MSKEERVGWEERGPRGPLRHHNQNENRVGRGFKEGVWSDVCEVVCVEWSECSGVFGVECAVYWLGP